VLERTYANGARLTYLNDQRTQDIGYDGIKRTVTLRHLRADNSLIAGFSYSYDRQNNKLSEQRLHQSNVSERYTYDSLYRLIQVAPSAGSTDTFQLDGVGNWMRRNNAANQVNVMNEYEQMGGVAQRHDDNGNVADDGRNRYEYDALNRLRRVTRKSDNAVVAVYRYDAFNRRVERVVTNSGALNERVQYVYDGWREIEERRGTAVQQYVYGMWIDEPLTLDQDQNNDGVVDQTFYYHQDGKANVVALTDAGGRIVQTITYDAYGRPSFGQNAVANPYLFAGRRYDPETGLYYFRARFYDPMRGRFLQRDPIGMWTDAANLGNGYTYVGNNPLSWTDPLGLVRIRVVKGGCSAFCGPGEIACCNPCDPGESGRCWNDCYCMTESEFDRYLDSGGFCKDWGRGSVNSCIGVNEFPVPPDWNGPCTVAAVACSWWQPKALDDAGQVSTLTPIQIRGSIRDQVPPSPLAPPPPRPQGPGSSRCGNGQGFSVIRISKGGGGAVECNPCTDKDGKPGGGGTCTTVFLPGGGEDCDPTACRVFGCDPKKGLSLPKSLLGPAARGALAVRQ
jgi:RHS repeat-associated protein